MITINNETINGIEKLNNFFEEPISKDFTDETTHQLLWKNQHITGHENIPVLRLAPGIISSYYYEDSPLSLYFSKSNTYYNSDKKSNVEELLNSDWQPTEEEYRVAQLAIQMINKYRITKYNEYPYVSPNIFSDNKGILLVDQIVDEESVLYGNATEKTFHEMFFHVFDNYNFSKIYIKLHPDTINNQKEGYLHNILKKHELMDHPSFIILDENCNMASVFDYINHVFVVTSQVGFEAILRNKEVTCFGSPFYSGYGFTNDIQKSNKQQRHPIDVFIAIMLKYTLYLNPFTNQKGNILDLLEYISLQQRHSNNNDILLYRTKIAKKKYLLFIKF